MSARTDFWARRKAAVQAEQAAETAASEEQAVQAKREALEAKEDAEVLAELDLPDPDALQIGDDVRGFMAQAVPERLRRRALRQLWRLNPALANIDGLVEYGEDYTDAACVIENLQTTYQVGKGMLAHVEEMARQAEAEAKAEADPSEDALSGPDEAVIAEIEQPTQVAKTPVDTPIDPPQDKQLATADLPDDTETSLPDPTPRRMRFDFEG